MRTFENVVENSQKLRFQKKFQKIFDLAPCKKRFSSLYSEDTSKEVKKCGDLESSVISVVGISKISRKRVNTSINARQNI